MKKIKILLLLLLVFAIMLSGCNAGDSKDQNPDASDKSNSQQDKKDDDASDLSVEMMPRSYAVLLDKYYHFIVNYEYNSEFETDDIDDSKAAIWEMMLTMESEKILDHVGYALLDINGDKVPELVIGDVNNEDGSNESGGIHALFTLEEDHPQLVLAGNPRDRYYYIGDNKFANQNDGGFEHSITALFALPKKDISLEPLDLYFAQDKDESGKEVGYYHSSTGDFTIEDATELDQEQFNTEVEKIVDQIVAIDYIPFSDHKLGPHALIEIRPSSQEELDYLADYDSFGTEDPDRAERITFYTSEHLNEFKLLDLEDGNIDKDGNFTFKEKVAYEMEVLDANRPFIAGVSFFGTIPNNGFSYVDEDGKERKFMIVESGLDGSISFVEYE
ncbi:MAG: hypothetical protein Q4D77_02975 [Peptostreptococcaceae bacterium]|nr:hypothetical protein [Peptostreptococcaceae bacterium]